MLVALRPGRRGAGRDVVVERQTPGLERGTKGRLGTCCSSDAGCLRWEWGRAGRFHRNGVIHRVDEQGILNTSLRAPCVPSQCVGGRVRISRQELGNTSDTGWESEGGAERKKKKGLRLQLRGRPLAPLCAPCALSF